LYKDITSNFTFFSSFYCSVAFCQLIINNYDDDDDDDEKASKSAALALNVCQHGSAYPMSALSIGPAHIADKFVCHKEHSS